MTGKDNEKTCNSMRQAKPDDPLNVHSWRHLCRSSRYDHADAGLSHTTITPEAWEKYFGTKPGQQPQPDQELQPFDPCTVRARFGN